MLKSNLRGCRVILSIVVVGIAGCGGAKEFEVAPVSGTVTCNGTPLKDGLVVFVPIPRGDVKTKDSGRSASGVIQPDGTYQLTTYNSADGAIVGSHNVQVFAPAPIDDDAPLTDANRYACGNAPLEKTVLEGKNTIHLELSFKKPAAGRR
jgi:hypothetical protein